MKVASLAEEERPVPPTPNWDNMVGKYYDDVMISFNYNLVIEPLFSF